MVVVNLLAKIINPPRLVPVLRMRVSLLLFLLLSLAETSLSQISLVLDAPVLSATTNNPSCVNFTFNSSMGNIPILAFDEIQLNGVLAPCANTLSVWIAMAGLNDSRAYLFANPGGCTPLNGDYAFSDNAENLEMALCPGWPPEGDPAQSLPTSKYQPQGVKLPGEVCNATVIEPSSLSVFNGRPYHQMQLCAMSTADRMIYLRYSP